MPFVRMRRIFLLLCALLTLTALVHSAGHAIQTPIIADRLPAGPLIGPLSLESYRQPEEWGLGNAPAEETEPPVSQDLPDMEWSRVVFQSFQNLHDYDIFIARPSGTGLQQLTSHPENDIQPRLNHGATEIVFSSYRDGNWEIYRVNSSGGDLRRLTFDGASDLNPSWSPDGRQIVFNSDRTGQHEIYTMNREGTNVRRLTYDAAYDGEPSWSPDGQQIAFASKRNGGYRIWAMTAEGNNAHMLSGEPYSGSPAWSPDGQRIMYHADGDNDGWLGIYVMNANGTNRQVLADLGGSSTSGHDLYAGNWSPDGAYVTYTEVYWSKYTGEWYWYEARLATEAVPGGTNGYFNYNWDTAWNPNWQSADASPPISQVYALPGHSHSDVNVTWTAQDIGGSGLARVLAQYRIGSVGEWATFSERTTFAQPDSEYHGLKTFERQPGQTVYFRSLAEDRGGNVEAWPAIGSDAHTTFYDRSISGHVNDNRDQPIARATLLAGPEAFEVYPSDVTGHYQSYFTGAESAALQGWAKEGYMQLPQVTLRGTHDREFDVVLPPADNVVADWGFESGEVGGGPWELLGTTIPDIGAAYGHTGEAGVFLGQPFDLEAPTLLREVADYATNLQIASDDLGHVHLLWTEGQSDAVLYYAIKLVDGAWSEPLALNSEPYGIGQVMWGVAADGEVHVVWYIRGSINHIQRSPDGIWSEVQIVQAEGYSQLTDLEVDGSGRVHLLWRVGVSQEDGNYYSRTDADGHWVPPIPIDGESGWRIEDLAVGPDGRPHLLWRSYDSPYPGSPTNLGYSSLSNDGAWSEHEQVKDFGGCSRTNLSIDASGQVHVLWSDGGTGQIYHRWRSPEGGWSDVAEIADASVDYISPFYSFLMDPTGVLHVTWLAGPTSECRYHYYARRDSDGHWSMPRNVSDENDCPGGLAWLQYGAGTVVLLSYSNPYIDDRFCIFYPDAGKAASSSCVVYPFRGSPEPLVDTSGNVHIAWKSSAEGGGYVLNYTQSKVATAADLSGISQQVTIPMTLTNPTLSVMYWLQGGRVGSGARLIAQIEDGSGPTTVLETDAVTSWNHLWADVSAWAGQTVTLTVRVEQAGGAPRVGVMLDEVTLGSAPPDLWLVLGGPPNVVTGEEFSLEVEYGNRIPSLASGVQVSLTLPAGLSYVSADPAPVETTPALIWDMGDLTTLEVQAPIIITVTMEAEFAPGLWVSASSEITGEDIEIEMANNTSRHSVRVGRLVWLPAIAR